MCRIRKNQLAVCQTLFYAYGNNFLKDIPKKTAAVETAASVLGVVDRMLGDLDLSVFRPGVDVRMLLEEIDSYLMRCVWQMFSAGKLDPDGLEKDFLKRVGQWRTAYLK